jgi:3-hydroxybutyrate dehydrogenase
MPAILKGRHALVTGGGTGIGLAIAQTLAQAGANVTITGRRHDVLEQAARSSPRLYHRTMDVRDESDVVDTIGVAVAAHGPIDICVANAGIAQGRALHETDMEFWRQIMATNLDGAFVTIRECLKSMHARPWGRVIAVSSIAGLKGLRGASAYTASKHGLIGLIRGLAADYVGGPITFNALCPGYVDTAIIGQNVTAIQDRTGMDAHSALGLMVNANPHKRLIAPSEIAAAALWLCAPGSDSVNGQAIEIAGGQV